MKIKTPNPVQAAHIAVNQAAKLQRQQTAANRVLARADRQEARYAKSHPLYGYTTPTSITDQQPQIGGTSYNTPDQVVKGNYDGSNVGTNATGGVTLDSTGTGPAGSTASTATTKSPLKKYLIVGGVVVIAIVLYMKFRK